MTSNKLFGTDGIRGSIKAKYLQPINIVKIGQILAIMAKNHTNFPFIKQALITIGRDTRSSGQYLEHCLIAGINSIGVDCELVGIVPSATLAFQTKQTKSAFGVMISASHNPASDNGLKIFDHCGFKITHAIEQAIEDLYFANNDLTDHISFTPGKSRINKFAVENYISMFKTVFSSGHLNGLSIIVDCANGAASNLVPLIFNQLGCNVSFIGCNPNGSNINKNCGSEAPTTLKNEVIRKKVDLGIALDGDADRAIFIDEKGQVIDGDAILAAIAIDLQQQGFLQNDTMVTTIMSSIALDKAVFPYGIKVTRTPVGDKFIARKMLKDGLTFGGENSGHIILFPQATTGDGIFSSIKFLDVLKKASMPASKFTEFYRATPKLLKNIEVKNKIPLNYLTKTQAAIFKANIGLKNLGRVILRYSGTENKARLLVEAQSVTECHAIANEISGLFNTEINHF
jgi:phosphoglucosamine mutase